VVYLYGSADADEPAMPREDRTRLARSVKSLQQSVREAGPAAAASYSLVGAILTLGGLGYLIDNWRGGTSHTWVISGLMLGIVVGFYTLIKSVRKR
jgi:F0F1-type ATP synthase assembly protein I